MSSVASQPKVARTREAAKSPMILRLLTTSIMTIISGAATMPFKTALQTSILIGSIGVMAPSAPARVAPPMIR